MRIRTKWQLIVVILSVTAVGIVPAKADSMDDFIAAEMRNCQERVQKLEEQTRQIKAKASAGVVDPQTTSHLREAAAVIDRIEKLEQTVPQAPAEKEAYARALADAAGQGKMTERSLNRDLGVPASGILDRVLDRGALFTYGAKGAPFDSPGPRTFTFDDLRRGARPQIVEEYTQLNVQEAKRFVDNYGSIGGGVLLEGTATGLGEVREARYDPELNALILDNRAVYFLKVAPWQAAILCRAIAEDYDAETHVNKQRLGVSAGRVMLSYGKLSKTTDVARDLFLVDMFLADAVFAKN